MSMIGKSLTHYEISSQIGKGGMGEVYQAKDLKLGRDVAIKVLPEEFVRDNDRVARFQREAKLLASLNHPNIAAIYGLEESGGTSFLVLELIDGDTLADRIKRGPIAVEEALTLALQIAEALETAHEKGVIHRDLKPANIKVTPDGKVKVLDFGLAKAFAGEQADLNLSNSPTLSVAATMQGVILGTAAYMSPEQAKGKSVDKRADIWAFGVVLYELLTGQPLFAGEDVSSTLARVLEREPDFSALPMNLHPRIRLLLERCLEKDYRNRYSGISDARVDIQGVLADPKGVIIKPGKEAEPGGKMRTVFAWIAATAIFCLIIAVVAVWKLKPSEPRKVMRFDYDLPEGQQFSEPVLPVLAVSPDGTQFVYSTSGGLYLRSEDELDARLIVGTDQNPTTPFFSPDGQWIGYFSGGAQPKLKKIAISGGAPFALCDVDAPAGASWGADDMIVYGQLFGPIMQISANGGNPEPLVEAEGIIYFPQILPDGKTVLFSHLSGNIAQVIVQSLEAGERKELFPGHTARYLPTGHIIYAADNNLLAVPFDLDSLEVLGGGVPLVESVLLNTTGQLMHYAISDSGTLVYSPGSGSASGARPERTLVWVNKGGQEEPLKAPPDIYQFPKISPDGTQVALVTDKSGNDDIWTWDLVHKNLKRLTFDDSTDSFPLWTPDGKRIAFLSLREGASGGILWKAADGTGKVEHLASAPGRILVPFSWSSDGNIIAMQEIWGGMTKIDIGMLSMEGDRTRKPLLQEDYLESHPSISPDGQWIAYCSDESGEVEIYVRPFPEVDSGGRWQVSTDGGSSPLWSPDGRELFYLIGMTTTEAVMRVAVETEPTFKYGNPEVLFRGTYVGFYPSDFPWDIHPGGKRFLMMKEVTSESTGGTSQPKIIVVTNWFEELKERVPVD